MKKEIKNQNFYFPPVLKWIKCLKVDHYNDQFIIWQREDNKQFFCDLFKEFQFETIELLKNFLDIQ
jgi:hypothetical protein